MSASTLCRTCGSPLVATRSGDFCPVCAWRSAEEASEDAVPALLAGNLPRPFGEYDLLAELGHGGMGLVFKARQRRPDRLVALKVLLTGRFSDAASRARFQREASAAARLQHPNIVAIHEVGEAEGHPYLTMDFVDGPTLAALCDKQPLAAELAMRHVRDVARAVEAAHQSGILHRDLKPSNVLIGSDGRPRVADFGLAKSIDETDDLTLTGQMLGSPNYAAPEQAAGRRAEISARTDVYGLGALLYHCVTGHAPFNAPTPAETLRLVLDVEPASPRLVNPALSRDLETVILKCLHKEPARRYATAAEVADELDRVLTSQPIHARPVSSFEQLWRWCRRHPAAAGLATTIALALVVTSTVLFVSARRIEHSRLREVAARRIAEENLYAADMEVIAGAFSSALSHDVRDTRLRLDAARPRPEGQDLRGFEWRYYWLRNRSDALATWSEHRHVVDAVSFAPDGTFAASHSIDGVLKVWSPSEPVAAHTHDGVAVLGGFSADGKTLGFSRPDRSIWRLDLATLAATQVHPATGRLIAMHPDGTRAVVFGADQLPKMITLDLSAPPEMIADVPEDTVAVVSRDGRRVAVAGRPYPGILVFDLETQQQVAALIDPRPVIALALSPDGSRLVSSGFDSVLKVWDVDGNREEHAFRPFVDPVWALAFSADGRTFAAAGHNRTITIRRTTDWTETASLNGHESTVRTLAFASDNERLLSGAEDEQVMLWPTRRSRAPDELRQALRGPRWIDRTPGMAFSPDSRLFAGTAADGTIKVWRADTLVEFATFPDDARTVGFSADGRELLSEGFDGVVRRWSLDAPRPEPVDTFVPAERFDAGISAGFSTEQRVAVLSERPDSHLVCRLCDVPNARDSVNAGGPSRATTQVTSSDGAGLFAGLPNGSVEIWDVKSRTQRLSFAAHKLPVTAITVSADGRLLATGSLDNSTALWRASTGELLTRIHVHNRPVWALAFSPDGETLAAGSCDKAIVLCSVRLRRHVATLPLYTREPQGYEQEVRLLRFSPDGNMLAAALGDGSVRFFRAASFAETDDAAAR